MNTLTLLIKPASSSCNLRCRYCFYEDESENRLQKSLGIMDAQTAEQVIREAMAYIGEYGTLSILFQGGEPTLAGPAWFDSFTQTARQLLPRGAQLHYAIQTNGVVLQPELLAVLKRERFLVGISLDGWRALHDRYRADPAGNGTWQRILKTLKRLQAEGIPVNALCVVTAQMAQDPCRAYRTLKGLGLQYHQYILCLDPLGEDRGSREYSLSPEAYGRFLKDTFDLWYADWKRGAYVSIRTFEDYVFNIMGVPCGNCATSGSCGGYLVLEADGSVYPCDFYALDAWKLGSIRERSVAELLSSAPLQEFAARRQTPPPECAACPYRQICRTGCCRDWVFADGTWHNYYCSAYQSFFAYALPRLQEIAAAEHKARR